MSQIPQVDTTHPVTGGASSPEKPDTGVHYDEPAAVFELLLDRNMNYSSGVYPQGDEDLDAAQVAKMERAARYLELKPGDRVLDAGCGWSGPALYFAEHFGCQVTGINLSPVQRRYGLEWAERRGVADRIKVDVCNLLEVPYPDASFDKIVFFESIIHMPEKDAIFELCHRLLSPGGRILIQESCYDRESQRERYLSDRGYDEVSRAFGYSAHLVSAGEMICRLEENGLFPQYLDNISVDYVRTLSQWLNNIDAHADEMRAVSEAAYWRLRRYLMVALATYRSGGTRCYMITAAKDGA